MSTTTTLRMALRGAFIGLAIAITATSAAQTATDACGYNVGNQYPVGTSCTYSDFDKPGSFTATYTASGCTGGNYDDAWGWFTATSANTNITFDPDNNHRPIMHVYTGTCTAGLTQVACVNSGGNGVNAAITGLATTPGTNYMIRIQRHNDNSGMDGRLCIWSPVLPVNDNPCGAIDLSPGTSCTLTNYSNVNATNTAGIPAPGCAGYAGGDVWFRFTAPASGLVTLRSTAGTLSNIGMAVYSATSCSGTFSLVLCDNASGPGNMPFITLTPLELSPGAVYYVRAWNNGGGTGTFNLCAFTAPGTGNCAYALHMYDSQGDGWGGSNVSIQIGAGPAVSYTNTNADREVAYITASIGETIQLSYNAVGGVQSEIRYLLQLINGPVYSDGPTPGTGIRYVGTVNCQSAAPTTSDCQGRTAVCGSQQISDNPTTTGLTADLHLHSRGCLGSNERQGSWYSFTPSAGGTLGFTIAPNNAADDYDFAIWGPFGSLTCPPIAAPVRCNYSGTTGNTGLSAAGTNPSEGSGGSKWSTLMTVSTGEAYLLYISNFSQSGLAFNLTWQLTNGASIDCNFLPVQLMSLNGAPVPEGIQLDWITATEINTAYFAVERQDETGEYQQIGQVSAAGNSTSTTAYEFLDAQPLPGFNYYRLKMIDIDGSSELSEVVAVANRYGSFVGGLFPNPAEDQISVVIDADAEMLAYLRVLDASGRLVGEHRSTVAAGQQTVTMPLNGLESGHYLLIASFGEGRSQNIGRFVVR
jgi:hypothetical protein